MNEELISKLKSFIKTTQRKQNDYDYYYQKKKQLSKICGWDSKEPDQELFDEYLKKLINKIEV